MGAHSGPNSIESGLVFAYDMGNTLNSWKGPPTTNLNTLESLNGMSGISLTYIGIERGWKKYGISGTWASGTYPFSLNISNATLSGTIAYSAQVTIKTNVRSKFLTFGGLNYVNDPNMVSGGTSTVTSLGNDRDGFEIILSKREGFIYSAGYANPTTSQLGYISSRPTADGVSFNSSTDFVWVRNIQVEQGTFCTPYANGTRSNTQAILDWTGNNTITANSLTYNVDGTFSFDGTANYITIPNTTLGNGNLPWTVSAWMKTTTTTNVLGQGAILSNAASGPVYSVMGVNNGKIVYWTYQSSAWSQKLGVGKTVNDGNWHMLTWVNYNNFTMDMYVDGLLDSNVPNSTSGNNNPVDRIGGSWNSRFPGSISVLSRYGRALTAAEVQQNFNALRGRYGL